jgi:predicted amino acid racemase
MYPKLTIDMKKLKSNLDAVAAITKDRGHCSMMIVTKGVCADRNVVEMVAKHPKVDYLADSRMKNIMSYAEYARANGKKTVLLRLPQASEIKEVVRYVDISFNSELSTIQLLDEEARKQGISHKVVLMIDLGDLREGIFTENSDEVFSTVRKTLAMKNIILHGLAVNLTCYGAIIPKEDNLSQLCNWADRIEGKLGIRLEMISGGNSSSIYLIDKGELPKRINNLRLGESFLLGNDTAYGTKLPGTVDDALLLEAQIIELKQKPSLPIGEVGVDAFGQKPYYDDRGIMKRAILAIGKQDIVVDSLEPVDSQIRVLGGSSDHLLLDLTAATHKYKVGDVLTFKVGYGAMLQAMTSPYVEKAYK